MKPSQVLCGLAVGCVAPAPEPTIDERQQDERIDVHGCRPGTIEISEGEDFTCAEPWPWPGGMWPTGPGEVGGNDRVHGPGSGPGNEGRGLGGAPMIFDKYATIGGTICRCVCLSIGVTVCAAMSFACTAGTVFTIGGVTFPCLTAAVAACNAGAWGTQVCTDYLCKE